MSTPASAPLNSVALFGTTGQTASQTELETLVHLLADSALKVQIHSALAESLAGRGVKIPASATVCAAFPPDCGAVISLGGDGTFLRATEWVLPHSVPIVGVNTGHLGYLASFTLDRSDELVRLLISGGLALERRAMLQLDAPGLPAHALPVALNEIAILKEDTSAMISVNICADKRFVADYLSDGLIISTPTGSTGYNLSVGGPILAPTLECWALAPIAPHTLTLRPLIIGADTKLTAVVTSRSPRFRISLDGRSYTLPCGTEITITRAPYHTILARDPEIDFASTLRDKLLWGRR